MIREINLSILVIALCASLSLVACAPRYEYKPVPVRTMDSFNNRVNFSSGVVAAYAIYDTKEASDYFGFDIKKAGVLPVQISVENHQQNANLTLTKASLLDAQGYLWEELPGDVVVRRIDEATSGGVSGQSGVKRSLLWGLTGGVLGAAVGIATGTNVAEAAGKGAAIGTAAGVTTSVLQSGEETDSSEENIYKDFSSRSIDNATIAPADTGNGLLYFPSEAAQPRKLNLTFVGASGPIQVEVAL